MRVLGVDPGSRSLGYGVVELGPSGQVLHVGHGVARAAEHLPLATRLKLLADQLQVVLRRFRPQAVAVEGVFTHKNVRSALVLGHARGVTLLLAAEAGLPVHEYAPARVKRSVGAGGRATKQGVERLVQALLQVDLKAERSDASDALAVALCHAQACRSPLGLLGATLSGRRRRGLETDFAARLSPAAFGPGRA